MIQLNELMGNYFIDYEGKVFKWELVHFHLLISAEIDINEMIKEPIPITEEWLLKFGFEKDTHIDGYKVIGKSDCYWIQEMRAVLFLKSDIRDINYPYIDMAGNHIRLDYIHQLQNLYFAITQKELTIV